MNIWIDIVNSPHVLFFGPIIKLLEERGHSINITAREYAQTVGMLDEFKMDYYLIGAHAGASMIRKTTDIFTRGLKLAGFAKGRKFERALTFNSPSLTLAAKYLQIPSIVFMDYEHQPLNHLTFRVCDKVVTPAVFPDASLVKYGAFHKTLKYNGLKEQVYLSDYNPVRDSLDFLGLDRNKVIVTARTPATMALYHRFENQLFYDLVGYLLKNKNVTVITIPRSSEQKKMLMEYANPNLVIPEKAVNGMDLIYYSDLVISAGGTMTREAAVMGTPSYTAFKGEIGAVDKYLIDQRRITPIFSTRDFSKITLIKKKAGKPLLNASLKNDLVDIILSSF